MKIYKDIEQGGPEWSLLRKGKMTASNAQAIGNNGKGLETYVYEIVAGVLSSANDESYTNPEIERGKELESVAREMYQLENGVTIEQVGFVESSEYVGASPDGLIGEDGGCEIKCHNDVKHVKLMAKGIDEIESSYIWQIQMNLLVTGRKWWDYIAYNPNFQKSLLVFRITPDESMQAKLIEGLKAGENKIKELFAKLK